MSLTMDMMKSHIQTIARTLYSYGILPNKLDSDQLHIFEKVVNSTAIEVGGCALQFVEQEEDYLHVELMFGTVAGHFKITNLTAMVSWHPD